MSCPDCFKGSLDSGTPTGEETKIAGLDAYVAKPKAGSEAGGEKKAVVLITDIFGWKLLNVRLVADEMANRLGHEVIIPDFFLGYPVAKDAIDVFLVPADSFFGRAGQWGTLFFRIPQTIHWMLTHTKPKCLPIIQKWFEEVKAERGIARLGAEGFCWGGRYSVILAGLGLVDYFVAAHPSSVEIEELNEMKRPGLFITVEKDFAFSDKHVAKVKELVEAKKEGCAISHKEFLGVKHGFAVRGLKSDPLVAQAREEALALAVQHFKASL